MSRFENSLSSGELYKIAVAFVDNFIQSYSEEPPIIILDPDEILKIFYIGVNVREIDQTESQDV
jgi:hypothetical protein